MTEKTNKDYIIIALKLLAICAIVALIVASVNHITKEKILDNQKQNTADALTSIFAEDFGGKTFSVSGEDFVIMSGDTLVAKCSVADCKLNEDVNALYVVENSQKQPIFYCVSTSPMGFKAEINMLVAINPDMTVKGVKIVSMSETSGIGTKAQDEAFLSKFVGKGEIETKEIDIISGATKTSKPVIEAVSDACNQVSIYKAALGGEQ